MFSQEFFRNQGFNIKKNQIVVCYNKQVLEIQVIS
jgi:hypothetical protein